LREVLDSGYNKDSRRRILKHEDGATSDAALALYDITYRIGK
jgi:hypothetical protein